MAEENEKVMSESYSIPAKQISADQRAMMLDYMKSHPTLATGRFMGPDGAKQKQRLMTELAAMLNCLPNGVTKSADKWMKSWQDWKSDVKTKAAILKKERAKTGGGTASNIKSLTALEEQLLAFLGHHIVSGHEEVPDPLDVTPQETGHGSGTTSDVDVGGYVDDDLPPKECDTVPPPVSPASSTPLVDSSGGSGSSLACSTPPSQDCERSCASSLLKKRKRNIGRTSTPQEDSLVDLTRQQLACMQEQNALRREHNALTQAQLQLEERRTFAIENAAVVFTGVMKALEEYLRHRRDMD